MPNVDRPADHVIDAAVLEQIRGLAVVGAEADSPAVGGRDQREQGVEVVRVGRLADQDVQPARSFSCASSTRDAFVIAADAGGDVCIERFADERGAVPVDRPARERAKLRRARPASPPMITPGKFITSARPCTDAVVEQFARSSRGERRAAGGHVASRGRNSGAMSDHAKRQAARRRRP